MAVHFQSEVVHDADSVFLMLSYKITTIIILQKLQMMRRFPFRKMMHGIQKSKCLKVHLRWRGQ